jgi:hypothetical protein
MEQESNILGNRKPLIRWLVYIACIIPTALFLFIALGRLFYPLALESMEGGTFVWVMQAFRTGVVYPTANPDYIPYNYTALHVYVSLLFSWLAGGPSFTLLRIISILSTLGTAYFVGRSLSEKSDPGKILIGAGLYLATYFPLYTWYDVGRVDQLATFFAVVASFLVWRGRNGLWFFLGGMFIGLAFVTKQVYITIAVSVLLYLLARDIKSILFALGGLFVGGFGVYWLIDIANQGNSWLYCFEIPSHFPVGTQPIKLFVLLKHLTMMAPLFIFALWQLLREIKPGKKGWLRSLLSNHFAMIFIWTLIFGVVFNMNPGAAANTLMIFVPFLVIMAGRWLLGTSLGRFPGWKAVILAAGIVFCIFSDGLPTGRIPSLAQEDYYERLTGFLRGEERPYLIEFPELVMLAGKPPIPDQLMVMAITRARKDVALEMERRQQAEYYSIIILLKGDAKSYWMKDGHYQELGNDILLDKSIPVDFGHYPIQPASVLIPSRRDKAEVLMRLAEHGLING